MKKAWEQVRTVKQKLADKQIEISRLERQLQEIPEKIMAAYFDRTPAYHKQLATDRLRKGELTLDEFEREYARTDFNRNIDFDEMTSLVRHERQQRVTEQSVLNNELTAALGAATLASVSDKIKSPVVEPLTKLFTVWAACQNAKRESTQPYTFFCEYLQPMLLEKSIQAEAEQMAQAFLAG